MTEVLQRTIKFYYLHLGRNEAGERITLNPSLIPRKIDEIWESGEGYMNYNQDRMYCQNHGGDQYSQGLFHKISMVKVRSTNMPHFHEDGGNLTPMPPGSQLGERCHICLFENNVVGVEYNHYAPRPTALLKYLQNNCSESFWAEGRMAALITRDVADKVMNMEDIALVRFSIERDAITEESVSDESPLGLALEDLAEYNLDEMQITLKRGKNNRSGFIDRAVLGRLRRWVSPNNDERMPEFNRIFIKGKMEGEDKLKHIDFFNNTIQKKGVEVNCEQNSRNASSDSAFAAIEEVFLELHNDIHASLPLQITGDD